MEQTKREQHDVITGRNAVLESLKSERELDTIYVAKGERDGSISQIIALAKKRILW